MSLFLILFVFIVATSCLIGIAIAKQFNHGGGTNYPDDDGEGSIPNQKKPTIEVTEDGIVVMRNANGYLHNECGPAVIRPDGKQEWYVNGIRYEKEIFDDLSFERISKDGTFMRCDSQGRLHNLFKPACELNGVQHWFKHGVRHYHKGPAVVKPNGENQWWVEGTQYTQLEFEDFSFGECGYWFDYKGYLHHRRAPAFDNGTIKLYFVHGVRHSLTGPAYEHANGHKEWWIEGKQYSEEEFNKIVKSLETLT